jgi:hypothetical protein
VEEQGEEVCVSRCRCNKLCCHNNTAIPNFFPGDGTSPHPSPTSRDIPTPLPTLPHPQTNHPQTKLGKKKRSYNQAELTFDRDRASPVIKMPNNIFEFYFLERHTLDRRGEGFHALYIPVRREEGIARTLYTWSAKLSA